MHNTVMTKLYVACLFFVICFKPARWIAKYYEEGMDPGTNP